MPSDAPNPEIPDRPELKGQVARGAVWVMGAGLLARVLGTLNTIIVARLLVPEDIGLVAVATIAMQMLQGFSDIGVSQTVVKFQDADRDDLDTLFTLSVVRGLIIGALLAGFALLAASIYGDPRMLGVFLGVSLFPVITGFINPRFYEFERALNFSREFISSVGNKLVGVIVSVGVALVFRTYWAIILGLLAGGVVQLALSYIMAPHRPRITFRSFRKVFGFTGWLAGVSFVAALNNKLDVPILARLVGAGGAGVYFMGAQLSEIAMGQIAVPFTRAVYPGLSTLQKETDRMRRAYLRSVAALGAVTMPAGLGLAFVAQDAVAVLLGQKWDSVVPVIEIMAPIIGLQSLFYTTQSYAMALGLTRLVFFRELIFFIIRLPVFVWAGVHYGLMGAVIVSAFAGLLHILLNLAIYGKASGRWFWEPLVCAWRSIGASVAMALYFFYLRPVIGEFEELPVLVRLIGDIGAGAIVYFAAHAALWRFAGRPAGVETDFTAAARAAKARLIKS